MGGLIGESYRSSGSDVIDASYSTCAVTGKSYIGGLSGSNEIDISASYAKGSVTGVEEDGIGFAYAGGLLGKTSARSEILMPGGVMYQGINMLAV